MKRRTAAIVGSGRNESGRDLKTDSRGQKIVAAHRDAADGIG